MWVVAGLGNPGEEYAGTRHNVGFLVADRLAAMDPNARWIPKGLSLSTRVTVANVSICLVKPQTYMNRSGGALAEVLLESALPTTRLVVLHDDVDLHFGILRLKSGGGHGGHNGMRSIVTALDSGDFLRVRIGIGRPESGPLIDHVLGPWDPAEAEALRGLIGAAAEATLQLLEEGLTKAANRWNVRSTPPAAQSKPQAPEKGCQDSGTPGDDGGKRPPGGDPGEGQDST